MELRHDETHDGTKVTFGDRIIFVGIPVKLSVPYYFDANLNIDIELEVFMREMAFDDARQRWIGPAVHVRSKSVSPDVIWSPGEHLVSVFCATLVGIALEKMSQPLLPHIVDQEMLPAVTRGLNDPVIRALDIMRSQDPGHRIYKLLALELHAGGLDIWACPKV